MLLQNLGLDTGNLVLIVFGIEVDDRGALFARSAPTKYTKTKAVADLGSSAKKQEKQ
jgi:hypothetical protein